MNGDGQMLVDGRLWMDINGQKEPDKRNWMERRWWTSNESSQTLHKILMNNDDNKQQQWQMLTTTDDDYDDVAEWSVSTSFAVMACKREFFFCTSCFIYLFIYFRTITRAVHYMTATSKTHNSALPRC
jgi:hypothetical protein